MKNGGRTPWNVTAIFETFKTLDWCEETPWRRSRLERWSNNNPLVIKTCVDCISLEQMSCQVFSLDESSFTRREKNHSPFYWSTLTYPKLHKFGCHARTPHRWLLEYWWVSRLVWSLDRFHTIYSTRRKSSWRIYVVREEINEKTADIQARSFMDRTLGENGKEWPAEGEAKVVAWKAPSWKCT